MIRFQTDKPVLVIGDVMLDYECEGVLGATSQDGPATVVRQTRTATSPGGAAHVAMNLKAMGIKPILVSAVGADWAAAELEAAIGRKYSQTRLPRFLMPGTTRSTTFRTSVKVDKRSLVRVDVESDASPFRVELFTEELAALISRERLLEQVGMVVYVDYGKGVLAQLPERLRSRLANLPTAVLAHPWMDVEDKHHGTTVFVANSKVARLPDSSVRQELTRYMTTCRQYHAMQDIVVTDWPFCLWGSPWREETFLRRGVTDHVVDFAGVEEAAFAALVAAKHGGYRLKEACDIAAHAAAVAASQYGKPVVGWFETNLSLCQHELSYKRIADVESAKLWAEAARAGMDRKIAFVSGAFDVLHPGHIDLLNEAKRMADLLVVAVEDDKLALAKRSDRRPVLSAQDRLTMLCSLAQVDAVCLVVNDPQIEKVVTALKPNFLVAGSDCRGHKVPGADYVSRNGGVVNFVQHQHKMSSTSLLEKAGITYQS